VRCRRRRSVAGVLPAFGAAGILPAEPRPELLLHLRKTCGILHEYSRSSPGVPGAIK